MRGKGEVYDNGERERESKGDSEGTRTRVMIRARERERESKGEVRKRVGVMITTKSIRTTNIPGRFLHLYLKINRTRLCRWPVRVSTDNVYEYEYVYVYVYVYVYEYVYVYVYLYVYVNKNQPLTSAPSSLILVIAFPLRLHFFPM